MSQEDIVELRRLYRACFGKNWPGSDKLMEQLWHSAQRGFAGRRAATVLLMKESSNA